MAVENGKIASGELKDTDKVVVDSFAALSPNDFDDTPTAESKKLMTSGAIKEALEQASEPSDYTQVKEQVQQNTQDISGIEAKIPAQASAQNKLADKAFVNSSIATNTATFRGTYNLVSDLRLTVSATHEQVAEAIATKLESLSITPENNDYCFVQVPRETSDPTVIDRVDRYKCSVTESGGVTTRVWDYEWSLNNSSFTSDQWNAINSGITSGLVEKLNGIEAGAQVNTIETVKVNGTALTPENKAVNVPVPVKATTTPVIAGNAAIGNSSKFAAENHVHPAETEVVAYRLPEDCFPITYTDSTLPSGQQSCTIVNNAGIRFEFVSTNNTVALHDIASEAAGGYEWGFSSFSASTLKWGGKDAPISSLKFNNTAPTENTWPVLEKDAVFVREKQVAKQEDVETALAGKLDNTGASEKFIDFGNGNKIGFSYFGTKLSISLYYLNTRMASFICDEGTVALENAFGHWALLPVANGALALISDMYAAVQQIAPMWSKPASGQTGTTYTKDISLCTYSGVLYQCANTYTTDSSSKSPPNDIYDSQHTEYHWTAKKVSELFLPLTGGVMAGDLALNSLTLFLAQHGPDGGTPYLRRHELSLVDSGIQTIYDVYSIWVDAYGSSQRKINFPSTSGTLALLQNLAPDFSTSATYVVGQLCVYANKLYRCTTAVTTAGAWMGSTNWTEATVQDILALLAPLESPAFSGRPTAPNMDAQSTDGQVANKKYVDDAVAGATPNLDYVMRVDPETGNIYYTTPDEQA